MWPCFLVWGVDRLLRLIRMVTFNHLYFGFSKNKGNLDGTVELLSPHFVRLRLNRPAHFHWGAGQTAFLTMPGVSRMPWEAHPFTISSIDASAKSIAAVEKEPGVSGETLPYWKELVFLINVRDGFTKRLAQAAEKGEKVKVLVDGPYGFTPSLGNDETVVLVAGASRGCHSK